MCEGDKNKEHAGRRQEAHNQRCIALCKWTHTHKSLTSIAGNYMVTGTKPALHAGSGTQQTKQLLDRETTLATESGLFFTDLRKRNTLRMYALAWLDVAKMPTVHVCKNLRVYIYIYR